jgi:hypothetical protein
MTALSKTQPNVLAGSSEMLNGDVPFKISLKVEHVCSAEKKN